VTKRDFKGISSGIFEVANTHFRCLLLYGKKYYWLVERYTRTPFYDKTLFQDFNQSEVLSKLKVQPFSLKQPPDKMGNYY
jgi:hypothetical protein